MPTLRQTSYLLYISATRVLMSSVIRETVREERAAVEIPVRDA